MKSHEVSGLPRWLSGKESASAGAIGDKGSMPGLGRSLGDGIWQPTSVFLPGKSHGQRNSAGYSPWSHKELDMTERLSTWSLQMVSLRYWQVISLLCLPASPSSWWGITVSIKSIHLCFLSKIIYWNLRCGWRRQWHPTPVLLSGKSHRWGSLVGCHLWGCTDSDTTECLHFHFSLSCIGEGNGNPLQCSCLENPRDRGAW